MSDCIELLLPSSSYESLQLVVNRIRELYDIRVELTMTIGSNDEERVVCKFIMNHKTGQNIEKAKDYLLSVCREDQAPRERRYSAEAYQRAASVRDDVERETGALLRLHPEHKMVLVSGREGCAEEALRLLDQRVGPPSSARQGLKQCRLLESEDSSYDSDYDVNDAEFRHDDVSRTVSDTLAAEYAEYVDEKSTDLRAIVSDPDYTSRVEFGLKLGYTECQVQTALQKVGARPGQNELLAELIKLGAAAGADDCGSDAGTADDAGDAPDLPSFDVDADDGSNLRHVVVDGSNVAISHGNKECFSCRGIKICVDWFRSRGHKDITVFVPRWRKEASRPDAPIKDQEILAQLEKERLLVFTPSRRVGGRRMVCYDDRYVLKLAVEVDGIVVSNDNYRDLANENPEYKKVVEEKLLMYSFVNDRFMPPDDPLGRHGPSLDNFLRKQPKAPETLPQPCPYGKKCTYGNKCKYYHPERGNQPQKSITERLAEQAKIQLQEVKSRGLKSRDSSPGTKLKTQSLPPSSETAASKVKKMPLSRTKSVAAATALPQELIAKKLPGATELENRRSIDDRLSVSAEQNTENASSCLATHLLSNVGDLHMGALGSSWSPLPMGVSATSVQTCVSNWATISPTLPQNISGSRVEMFLEPDKGGHLSVAKRLSDPDNISTSAGLGFNQVASTSAGGVTSEDNSATNLHRKLQRQLTLNPVCDPRLYQLRGFSGGTQRMMSPQPEHFNLISQQVEHPLLMHRASSQENIHSRSSYARNQHRTRMCSDKTSLSVPSHPQPWENLTTDRQEHHSVTRIASAPDSYRQWPPPSGRMQRLNSTSDTRLNVFPEVSPAQQVQTCPPGMLGNYLGEMPAQSWLMQSDTGLQMMGATPPVMQTSSRWPDVHGTGLNISQLNQPVRPSSVPPQAVQLGTMSPLGTPRAMSPDLSDESRYKLYYHLSSIFPEQQVRVAMDMYPEEKNPQKICAAILTLYPK
ncbi:probable ribonuclease ZC3H12C isoform X1 [Centruroides vittatus]|uniref:probable ribonuclease ZC3H12C isoform X1 n=2 Tax=Centruroides vittatus TaxID=120091 RepID=UPI00350F546E